MLLFPALLAVVEVLARGAGYQPSVQDSKALWAMHRDAVRENGPESVVLLGASRMQLGVDPEILQDALAERKVFSLTFYGKYPMAMLEHLAGDEAFSGVVLCSFAARWTEQELWDRQLDLLEYWADDWSTPKELGCLAHLFLQENFAVLHEGLTLISLKGRLEGRQQPYLVCRRTRYRSADYLAMHAYVPVYRSRLVEGMRRAYSTRAPLGQEEFLAQCDRLERAVRAIQDRGGRVVFVRLPTSGEVWELDEQYYPKEQYWDVFAKRTAAATIHFNDYETLASFECPDGSHLDYRDAAVFTRNLAKILKEKIE